MMTFQMNMADRGDVVMGKLYLQALCMLFFSPIMKGELHERKRNKKETGGDEPAG